VCIVLYLQSTGRVFSDAGLAHLFLALLEASEVVLYEERRVELTHCHVVTLS